ncbi:MAG: hypothetical protein ACOY3I_08465 [Verrucomicrobiota bacterium]
MKYGFLLLFLFFVTSSVWSQKIIDPATLVELDANEDLAKAVGYDRLSKYLIDAADARDQQQRINRSQVLDKVVVNMIKDGSAFALIQKDLARGDVYLRDTLVRVFKTFNFSDYQSNKYLEDWATEGAHEIIRKTMNNLTTKESTLRILTDYNMRTPEEWTRILQGMSDVFVGKSPITIPLMADTLVRSRAVSDVIARKSIEDIQKGSINARWDLAFGMTKIMNGYGALARFFAKSQVPEGSWNFEVWRRVVERIGDDPLLREEYIHRLSNAAPLYEQMREVLAQAIEKEGVAFLGGYLEGARIPGSLFVWTRDNLAKSRSELRDLKKPDNVFASTLRLAGAELARKIRRKDDTGYRWANHFFWHLTRPGEAVVFVTRVGMGAGLANDEAAARALTRDMLPFGDDVQVILQNNGAFSYYKGGESEFREKIKNGTVERAALLHYSSTMGRIVLPEAGDYAWTLMLNRRSESSSILLREMLRTAVEAEPKALLGWIQTVRTGDKFLRERFIGFLKEKNRIKNKKNFDAWIESIGAAIAGNDVVGNNDVSDFKGWFIEFFNTPQGWEAIRLRMELESTKVPYRLRDAMEEVLIKDPDAFWRIYSMLTAATGPSVATLLPALKFHVLKSRIPQFLLEEIGFRNTAAADSVDPVWTIMFSQESPLPDSIIKYVTGGAVADEICRLLVLALQKTLSDDKMWKLVSDQAALHLKKTKDTPDQELREAMFAQMNLQVFDTIPFLSKALANPTIKAAWRFRMMNSVKFLGQAYIVANFISRQPDLQPYWSDAVSNIIAREPKIIKVVLEALASRKVGDVVWDRQMTQARRQVIRIILDDRVLFEQLSNEQISGWKTTEFRSMLERKLKGK